MSKIEYEIITLENRSDLVERREKMCSEVWADFMTHDAILNEHWHYIGEHYGHYQFVMMKEGEDEMLAAANCIPLPFDSDPKELSEAGIDWMFEELDRTAGFEGQAKSLFAIQIVINPEFLGSGLSYEAVKTMVEIGRKNGCKALYAPVRPNKKCDYPLMDMDAYVNLKNDDGHPFDPWMRVHTKLGGEIVKVCPKSMDIRGTVAQWEEWAKMKFPVSGKYTVPGALAPVDVDLDKDEIVYIEPNVWMRHRV